MDTFYTETETLIDNVDIDITNIPNSLLSDTHLTHPHPPAHTLVAA